MKTMKYISLRVLAIAALALAFAMPAKACLLYTSDAADE